MKKLYPNYCENFGFPEQKKKFLKHAQVLDNPKNPGLWDFSLVDRGGVRGQNVLVWEYHDEN